MSRPLKTSTKSTSLLGKPDVHLGQIFSPALKANLAKVLAQIVGARYVLSKTEELAVYDSDGSTLVTSRPDLVVLPKTAEEVQTIVQACLKFNVPYIARGGGTGLSGGTLALAGGVVIGLNRLDQILEIDSANQCATVEVGVINAWLNRDVAQYGLFYAPDPSSQSACTIGGNIAENAGGIHCAKYGATMDHILALQMVLPDGSLTWLGSKHRRHSGINWVNLIVGSEGTLGIVTKAIVRLLPKPEAVQVYLAAFPSMTAATQLVETLVQSSLMPAALEFMDAFTVKAVNEAFGVGFPEDCHALLLIELDGQADDLKKRHEALIALLTQHNVTQVRIGKTESERLALWKARKGTVVAYGRYAPAFYLHDCVIPRSKLTEVLTRIDEIAREHQLVMASVFHAGDGNLHPHILFDPNDASDPTVLKRVMAGGDAIVRACLDAGGLLSGEHGIGIEKSAFMSEQFSPDDLARMMAIKQALDPSGLANPAKIFPVRKSCGETKLMLTHHMLISRELWV
ncbi:MAG: FAD-linked oxidase C-terminal domain-containing protein [Vampirovibrionales bacterium]|nr:FAD-linked oxidase C-terminal domain-containing protein [Vampirovibrionales bacterium]